MTATFVLGTHIRKWLCRTDVPLMISRRRLRQRREIRALGNWILDCGGFSELNLYGGWSIGDREYAAEVRWLVDTLGGLQWAACRDWMCEPFMLRKTGLDIPTHQQRTLASYLDLRQIDPTLPFAPVLQGWGLRDYLAHADLYESEGVDLAALPIVGLGSVCRRQDSYEIEAIVRTLAQRGYRLHGFGMKLGGLIRCADMLASADSMAWSFDARRHNVRMDGHAHKTCANCLEYALHWRWQLLGRVGARNSAPPMFA